MKLSLKALTLTVAILWGATFLVVAGANLLWPPYGAAFLEIMSSIYPGYEAAGTQGSVIVGTLYALLDGAIGGALFAWIYNSCAG
ncbi:MAG: hypothetical protein ACE5I0_11380 [Candidatus Binatia bacterium]